MPDTDINLPKINLDTQPTSVVNDNSVLIPKIDEEAATTQVPPVEPQKAAPRVSNTPPVSPSAFKKKKIILGVVAFIAIFIIYNVIAGLLLYSSANKLMASGKKLSDAAKSQDLAKISTEMKLTRSSLTKFGTIYKMLSWAKILPFVGSYVSDLGRVIKAGGAGLDAGEIVIDTAKPYSDLLGLKDATSNVLSATDGGTKSTQERIDFIVKTIPDLLPKVDLISAKVAIVRDELLQINAEKYPEKFKGKALRSQIKSGQELITEAGTFIVNIKPVLEATPYLLGMDSPRTYLVLFQNDKEIRPTGGFLTAYSIMKVDKAKFEPVLSNDIYNLDALYKSSVKAPQPIIDYIKGPYVISQNLRLRDMNWSPDFAESMKMFSEAASQAGIKNIDGIIAVDTQVLVNLLNVIGPIGVPGFGNFSTNIEPKCNCPQVIYELESFADVEGPIIWDPVTGKIILRPANSDNRKKIIGPLMNSILANAYGQPKEKLPGLFQAAFTSLIEKHVLFYMMDSKYQTAMSDFGLAGTIKDYSGDYLHISDANLGGRKSNLYATSEVEQDIKVARDGTVTKTVTITYKNPEKQDGWLNSVLPTWVRVYVPKGSKLIASEGLEAKTDPYEDLGKTVFAGFFQLRPEGVSKVTFQYTLPFKVTKNYKLYIQKQPGTDGFLYTVKLGKIVEEFFLKTDRELKIGI